MATINFLAGDNFTIYDLAGSGLGFYGPGNFGSSVRVGDYQDNTYITDATGSVNGPKVNNVKWVHPNSGQLSGGDTHALQDIPNYLATLNVRFSHASAVKTQNATVTIFDRTSTNNPAVGVTCKVAEVVHPWNTTQPTGPLGSGNTAWSMPGGTGGTYNGRTYDPPLALAPSPGSGGWSPSGANTTDTQHDWALVLAASPDNIGSHQQFALFFSCEYL